MALSKELQDELTCPIHLEFYKEPMQLKCLHLLCKEDVDKLLDQDDLLQCPQCKRVSQRKDIKYDFRMQRLIDLHKNDTDRLKGKKLCDICEDEVVASWCTDCEVYLGERCKRAHEKVKATRQHKLTDISQLKEEVVIKITKLCEKMNLIAKQCQTRRDSWIQYKSELEKERSSSVEKIKKHEQELMKDLKEMYDSLGQEYENHATRQQKHADSVLISLKQCHEELVKETQFLKDIADENDTNTLLDKTSTSSVMETSNEKCLKFEKLIRAAAVPKSERTSEFKTYPEIDKKLDRLTVFHKTLSSDVSSESDSPRKTWKEFKDSKGTFVDIYTYRETVRSIACINDHIWSVMEDGSIKTIKQDSHGMFSPIRHFYVLDTKSVYKASKVISFMDKIAVACEGELFIINTDGLVQSCVDHDNYVDVKACGNYLYGHMIQSNVFSGDRHMIKGHVYEENLWKCHKIIKLHGKITSFSIHGNQLTFAREYLLENFLGPFIHTTTLHRFDVTKNTETDLQVFNDSNEHHASCILGDKYGLALCVKKYIFNGFVSHAVYPKLLLLMNDDLLIDSLGVDGSFHSPNGYNDVAVDPEGRPLILYGLSLYKFQEK